MGNGGGSEMIVAGASLGSEGGTCCVGGAAGGGPGGLSISAMSGSCAEGQSADGNGRSLLPEVAERIKMQQTAAKANETRRARREPQRRRNSLRGWLSCRRCVGSIDGERMVVVGEREEGVHRQRQVNAEISRRISAC